MDDPTGMRLVFDLESDGLLEEVSKVHCIVIKNLDTNEVINLKLNKAMEMLASADLIIGHNIIKYDIPVLQKLYGFRTEAKIFDTIVAARLFYPDIRDRDFRKPDFPKNMIGRHSLEAWGHRIGNYKGQIVTDWKEFTQEMLQYCIQDVEVTATLYNILTQTKQPDALDLEHKVAQIIFRQEQHGFYFDRAAGEELFATLNARRLELEDELQNIFPPIVERTKFIPKVNNKSRGYIKGVPYMKLKKVTFNPSSRMHIADRLKNKYDWQPVEFTPDGKPKVDETVLEKLKYPEAKILSEHFLIEKRIAQLAVGAQAWLKQERNGRIHGNCNTNSTVTGRASHTHPNLGQVPSIHKTYGKECRQLFRATPGKKMVGIDISGLEVRMLAHYLAKYDAGDYTDVVLNGDIHTNTQELAGLESRDIAKRFYYCFLYGGGVKKIAQVTGKKVGEASKIKTRFLNNLPALNKLIKDVQRASTRGYIVGLDGRHVKVRSQHSALNTLLQSSGAIVCKQWLVEFDKNIKRLPDVQQVVWVHDEIQVECDADDAETVGQLAVDAIQNTGMHFKLRIPLTGEYKVGESWADTH
tara:strand:- start:2212 stop:3957 length:1746 start_codon:yes stop_codon:yes gene_type:complete